MTPRDKTGYIIFNMPGRKIPLISEEIYHVFSRGIASQPIFFDKRDYQRFLNAVVYYRNCSPPMKLSLFLTASLAAREKFIQESQKVGKFLVEIICFSLMPNHFHFLLRQITESGISDFIGNLTNSYTRYLNTRQKRVGPFLQGRFKAVRIETNEQLLHVSRYIHLNPLTSLVVKDFNDLESYPYSSFPEYLKEPRVELCQKEIILGQFRSREAYRKFVFDQADYQRKLDVIKHLMLE